MGNAQGKKTEDPFFQDEWRKVEWGNPGKLVNKLKEFEPENENVKHIRILLHGPVGSGKSSFINSVTSILRGRMVHDAHVATGTGKSYTTTTQTHKIKKGKAQPFYPFVFSDLMGLEAKDGIPEEDIKLALKGHIRDNYTFNPNGPIKNTDPFYNPDPAPEDTTHVLVSIIPADKVRLLSPELIEKIQHIRRTASDLGIPQICVITKIDQVCDEVQKDIKHVYKMKAIKTKMVEFSEKSGIPMTCIFPVKNYHEETSMNDDFDVLLLEALQFMINLGEDFIDKKYTSY